MSDHLDALKLRLSNERTRLTAAKTDAERRLRGVWITQLEKEIADEDEAPLAPISDDELLQQLGL